jgi:hypothetical protein
MALLQKCSGMLPVGHSEQSMAVMDVVFTKLAGNGALRADQNG